VIKKKLRRTIDILFALFAAAFALQACLPAAQPTLRYTTDDKRLYAALVAARKQLLTRGIIIAKQITIMMKGRGLQVRFAPIDEINERCENTASNLYGCTNYADANYNAFDIWIREDFSGPGLTRLVLHEMIHALSPGIEHMPPDKYGIFTLQQSDALELTDDDVEYLSQYLVVDWPAV
jgi:hypothetical protein